jgi:hypothetical protein
MSTHMLPRQGERNRRLRAEGKAAKSLAVIIIMFVISWLPLYTLNTVNCFSPHVKIPPEAFKFTIALSHLNSVWNPVLYAWGMSDFKEALRRLFGMKSNPRTLSVVWRQQFRMTCDVIGTSKTDGGSRPPRKSMILCNVQYSSEGIGVWVVTVTIMIHWGRTSSLPFLKLNHYLSKDCYIGVPVFII